MGGGGGGGGRSAVTAGHWTNSGQSCNVCQVKLSGQNNMNKVKNMTTKCPVNLVRDIIEITSPQWWPPNATIYFDFKEIPSTWLLFGITLLTLVQSCPTQPFHTFYEGDVNCLLQHQVVRIPLDAIRIHHRAVDGIHAGIDRTCWDCMLEPVQYHVGDLDWNTGTRRQRHVALWSIRFGHSSVDMHGVFPALKERDDDIGQLPCSHVAIVFTSHVPDVKIQFRQVESWVEEKVSLTPPPGKNILGNNILGNNFMGGFNNFVNVSHLRP